MFFNYRLSFLPQELLQVVVKLFCSGLANGLHFFQFNFLIYNPTVKLLNMCFGQMLLHMIQYSSHLLYFTGSSFKSQEILKKERKSMMFYWQSRSVVSTTPTTIFQAGTETCPLLNTQYKRRAMKTWLTSMENDRKRIYVGCRMCVYIWLTRNGSSRIMQGHHERQG